MAAAFVEARARHGHRLRVDPGDGPVGHRDADSRPGARGDHRGGRHLGASRHLVGSQPHRPRDPEADPRLHADDAGVRLPDPGDHLLLDRRRSRCRLDRHLRSAAGCATDRARHPRGGLRDGRGRTRVRCDPRSDPPRHPAAARDAHHHGGRQSGHHARAVDGGRRRHRRGGRPGQGSGAVDLDRQPAQGCRGGSERRGARGLPRPVDRGPRQPCRQPWFAAGPALASPRRALRDRRHGRTHRCAARRHVFVGCRERGRAREGLAASSAGVDGALRPGIPPSSA